MKRGPDLNDAPPSSPVTAHAVDDRLHVLEAGHAPMAVAPLSAAERLATLEEQARQQSAVNASLAQGMTALVERVAKMERKILIAGILVFAGTTNGTALFDVLAKLAQ